MARLQETYKNDVVPQLREQFKYASLMEVPRITKITLNMGLGEAIGDKKIIENAVADLEKITGQKCVVTHARKSIAGFKVREGWPIGVKVTLRRERMYLIPGDSPMGYRLPLDSLPWAAPETIPAQHERDPFEARGTLPSYHGVNGRGREQPSSSLAAVRAAVAAQQRQLVHQIAGLAPEENPFVSLCGDHLVACEVKGSAPPMR